MATKSANVMARVEPDIKAQAETVLDKLGLPVSVVINALYRQIIMSNGLPFSLVVPHTVPTRDGMTKEDFDAMMKNSLEQAKAGQGLDIDAAFAKIRESI